LDGLFASSSDAHNLEHVIFSRTSNDCAEIITGYNLLRQIGNDSNNNICQYTTIIYVRNTYFRGDKRRPARRLAAGDN
jgi:hypothetical protein